MELIYTRRHYKPTGRVSKDKEKVKRAAIAAGRHVLWKSSEGLWHAATDRNNTPHDAVETEDV